ncbi:unknown [Prevotella sp. CAG:1320]|nr:unknown [Prevotella sp. CAG:1320]
MNTFSNSITDVLKIALVTSTAFSPTVAARAVFNQQDQANTIAYNKPTITDTRSDKLTARFEVNVPAKKSFKERYSRIANSAWFKRNYHGKSVDFIKIDD